MNIYTKPICISSKEIKNLLKSSRSDDNVVDGDENELDKEAYESHNHESNRSPYSHFREFYSNESIEQSIRIKINKQNVAVASDPIDKRKKKQQNDLCDRAYDIS